MTATQLRHVSYLDPPLCLALALPLYEWFNKLELSHSASYTDKYKFVQPYISVTIFYNYNWTSTCTCEDTPVYFVICSNTNVPSGNVVL